MAGAAADGARFISPEAPEHWLPGYPDLLRPASTRREEVERPRYPLIRRRVPFLGWQLYRYRFFTRPAVSSACNPDVIIPVETWTPPGGGGGKRTRVRRSSVQSVYMLVQLFNVSTAGPSWQAQQWMEPSLFRGRPPGVGLPAIPTYYGRPLPVVRRQGDRATR